MLVFRPITKSKGLKPAAAGQPSPGDESNNRGGGCSTCTPCSFWSVGWFTARRGWAGQAICFVPQACLLARASRSCPGSRQRSRVSCSPIETEPSLSSGGRQMLALVLLELAAGALDGVSRESRASTSWFSTLPNNESTFPKGRLGSGGSPPGVISLLATERLTGGGMQREFQQTLYRIHVHIIRTGSKRRGSSWRKTTAQLACSGAARGHPETCPTCAVQHPLAPAELSMRWQTDLPPSTAFSYEPWPYGNWEPLIR